MCKHHAVSTSAIVHGPGSDSESPTALPGEQLRIQWIGSPNLWTGRKNHRPEAILIHRLEGALKDADTMFSDSSTRVSAHYSIGTNGEIHQYVDEENTAWHAGYAKVTTTWSLFKPNVNLNLYTIGLQHEGNSAEPWTESMYQASAALIRDVCNRWEIPLDAEHIIGHDRVSNTDCPGVTVDLAQLISLTQAGTSTGMSVRAFTAHALDFTNSTSSAEIGSCGDYTALDFLDNEMAPSMGLHEVHALPCSQVYIVASGDTLFQIARRFDITVQELRQFNPQITNPDLIFVGQALCIPGNVGLPPDTPITVTKGFEPPIGTEIERRSGQIWPGHWIDANPYGSHYAFGIHTGADLNLNFPHWDADRDAPVYAIGDGEVTFARSLGTWGNLVIIHHDPLPNGQRVYSRSAHLRTIDVNVGQRVRRGQRIGRVGSASGRFPFHLHFDISATETLRHSPGDWPRWDQSRIDRDYVDPKAFLQRNHAVQFV